MRTVILIGGAPCTGKTTLAHTIAQTYQCPFVSADFIRSWMKTLVSPQEYPSLFNFPHATAEEYYSNHSAQEAEQDEYERDKEVFKGVKRFIETNDEWDLFVIEGISIRPDFMKELVSDEYLILPVFLVDMDEQRIRETIYARGLWSNAETYEGWVKEIEVEWVTQTNQLILAACKELRLKHFLISPSREDTAKEVLFYLSGQLATNLS